MGFWWLPAFVWTSAYLVGAIPFGYLVARARGVDIFQGGSGNIGATNVGRILGKKFGILVFVLDFAKGALPVLAALWWKHQHAPEEPAWLHEGWLEVGAGLAAILGHMFPVYLGFRGGKGVATGAGVVAVLFPVPFLGAVLVWLTVAAATSIVSLASLAAAAALAGLHFAFSPQLGLTNPRSLFCLIAAALVIVRHRSNIGRLLEGNENRTKGDTMPNLAKTMHVLFLGLWFGSVVFFSFVTAPLLFQAFEGLGKNPDRPEWFPLTRPFDKVTEDLDGKKEQGSRAAGYAVGPIFPWYFLLQGVCGFVTVVTALAWARRNRTERIHSWRANLLILALASVLIGWPVEKKVTDLREPRNAATQAYLQASDSDAAALETMKQARREFLSWHMVSLVLNFVTVLGVGAALALATRLPQSDTTQTIPS
ncbi:MAG: glycerol-3-phosphate 1-O-acyltransferase PlsY [Gemmataceae bacterium]|nr:glycerol-3-phosphate 1-O-acyltransferase PlsY [Gemmataceae bacterium]